MPPEMIDTLTQFGAAGLMGVLWLWERLLSRQRERQLSEAHDRLIQHRQDVKVLVKLVRQNTQAIEQFSQTQSQFNQLLDKVHHAINSRAA